MVPEKKQIVTFLSERVKFFEKQDLTREELTKIAAVIKYERISEKELIFEFGQKGDKFYIILTGEVKVLVPPKKNPGDSRESSTLGSHRSNKSA